MEINTKTIHTSYSFIKENKTQILLSMSFENSIYSISEIEYEITCNNRANRDNNITYLSVSYSVSHLPFL